MENISIVEGSQPIMTQEELERYEQLKNEMLINEQVSTVKQAKAQASKVIKQERKDAAQAVKTAELQSRINMYEALGVNVNYSTGLPEHTLDNYANLLENDKMHFKPFRFNEFSEEIIYGDESMSDPLMAVLLYTTSQLCKFDSRVKLQDAMMVVAQKNKFHEIKEYLNSLKWDQTKRIETMFSDYLGADDTKLYRTMARIWMIAAVDRIFRPGNKFDNIIIFSGPQGIGKSNFCERLAVNPDWYCEDIQIGDKDGYQQLQSSWIVNMDEITSLNKKDAATAKNFLTKTHDKYRDPYGHFPKNHPRHCIFVGTTNEDTFLKDSTAVTERRYWVVRCSGSRSTAIKRIGKLTPMVVDQLWAEAVTYYNYMIEKAKEELLKESPDGKVDDKKIRLKLYIPDNLWDDFVNDQLQYKTENESELFEFLDEALNRAYEDFKDDSSLSNQYNGQFLNSSTPRKQDIFTINSLNKLLTDNRIFSWRGAVKQYAAMRSDEWEYKNVKAYGRVVKGLKRVDSPVTEEDITEPINSIFEL